MVWLDYEIQSSTRHCAKSGRELLAGESYFSVIVPEGSGVKRLDYAADAWEGPPADAIGWWKSTREQSESRGPHWAPGDVVLNFFDELEQHPENQDMRYVLALFLVRRRIMRLEETETNEQGQEELVLYCPRRETTYRVPVLVPSDSRIDEIQEQLARLIE